MGRAVVVVEIRHRAFSAWNNIGIGEVAAIVGVDKRLRLRTVPQQRLDGVHVLGAEASAAEKHRCLGRSGYLQFDDLRFRGGQQRRPGLPLDIAGNQTVIE
jgi:hypothetical protein